MNILVLQETDWLTRGPHTQHHIFEKLSERPSISITVLDYDIDKLQKFRSPYVKKQIFHNIHRVSDDSNITIIRTAHLQIPFLRRISSLITNFFEILRIIRKNRPDVIVAFSITNGFIGLFLAKLFKIPYIFFYIDILHELVPIAYVRRLARVITNFVLNRSDRIFVHTKFQNKYLIGGLYKENNDAGLFVIDVSTGKVVSVNASLIPSIGYSQDSFITLYSFGLYSLSFLLGTGFIVFILGLKRHKRK